MSDEELIAEARREAFRRYDGDRIIDERTGEEVSHDDWGFSEADRAAFVAGAEWQASLPPTEAEVERAKSEIRDHVSLVGFTPYDDPHVREQALTEVIRAALTAAREAIR